MVAVVTTQDRPRGRGLEVKANPVKVKCEEAKIRVFSFASLRDSEARQAISALEPDVFVAASYGKLIPDAWLKIPKKAALNAHPSLLPKHRGAAPIAWQILEGDQETGVSIAEVTPELDAGDLFCQIRVPLGERETARTLAENLSHLSVKALAEVFKALEKGGLKRTPQSGEGSYAKKLVKEDGHLNLKEPAEKLDRKIRAFDPWPGTFIDFRGKSLRITEAVLDPSGSEPAQVGTLVEITPRGGLRVQTGKGNLEILKVQLPGRPVISGKEFANGQRLKPGLVF